MISNIPKIFFSEKESAEKGIEIIDLDSIYSRAPTLANDPTKPHRVDFYLLIYITHGQGSHFIDFNHYPYQQGSFILINKDQIQCFDLINKPKGKVIIFNQAFVDEISNKLRIPLFSQHYLLNTYLPVFNSSKDLKQSCDSLLIEMSKENSLTNTDSTIIELLFSSLLLKLIRERPKNIHHSLNAKQVKKITIFLNLIEEYYNVNRNVAFYANKMAMSYKQLNKLCKSTSKKTAKQLIDSYIIIESKRKLAIEQSAVKEISYELGFDEISNFIKFFKKHTKQTPSQFKKIYQG